MSRTSANQFTDDETLAAPHTEVLPHMQCMGEVESRCVQKPNEMLWLLIASLANLVLGCSPVGLSVGSLEPLLLTIMQPQSSVPGDITLYALKSPGDRLCPWWWTSTRIMK
jgi:hypothetical protein